MRVEMDEFFDALYDDYSELTFVNAEVGMGFTVLDAEDNIVGMVTFSPENGFIFELINEEDG